MKSRRAQLPLLVALCVAVVFSGLLVRDARAQDRSRLIEVLDDGGTAFGTFVREKSPEQARELASHERLDFVFYDMERGDFDIPLLETFLGALRSDGDAPTVIVRIPPIHSDPAAAQTRTEQLIAAGADGVAFPHIMSADEAAQAVSWIEAATDRMWPANPDGNFISFVMIEDPAVVAEAHRITKTRGVSIFSPGPGSLRGAYGGDMGKVREAVTTVLEACLAAKVPCANTANETDVVSKVNDGFRVLIGLSEETLALGRRAAGRD